VSGWAIDDFGAPTGTGVDTVHVWAFPQSGSAQFLGVAAYGLGRPDVATAFGPQFTNSGFSLSVNGLAPGTYTLVAYAHSVTNGFDQWQTAVVTLPSTLPRMSADVPANNSVLGPTFTVAGWAFDQMSSSGSGVDAVHVWAYPRTDTGLGTPIFLGAAALGIPRPDVGGIFGNQFATSGYVLQVSGLALGSYRLVIYAHSVAAGAFNQSQYVDVTVSAMPFMALDIPTDGATGSSFLVSGWAIDRAAASGPGVDAVHVWAFPTTGSPAIFVGVASYGGARPDVGAIYGAQFNNSGYSLIVPSLASGTYNLAVYAHSTIAGFNQVKVTTIQVR
jgi:hypothetical protein